MTSLMTSSRIIIIDTKRATSQTSLPVSFIEVLVSYNRCALLRYLQRLILASEPCRLPACSTVFYLLYVLYYLCVGTVENHGKKCMAKHGRLLWKLQKSRQKHGIKSRAQRPLYTCTVYKIQHLALSTIITCSARFSSVKFCHCVALTNSRKQKIHTSTMMSW